VRLDGWPLVYEERGVGLIVRAVSFQDFQPTVCGPDPGDPPTLQTDGQTDGRHTIARLRFAL